MAYFSRFFVLLLILWPEIKILAALRTHQEMPLPVLKVDDLSTEKDKNDFPYNSLLVRGFYEWGGGETDDKPRMMRRKGDYDVSDKRNETGRKVDDPPAIKNQVDFSSLSLLHVGNFFEWGGGNNNDKPGITDREDDDGGNGHREEWTQKVDSEDDLLGESNSGYNGENNHPTWQEDSEIDRKNEIDRHSKGNKHTNKQKEEIDKIKLDILGILLAIYVKLVISTGISSVFLFLGSVIYQLAIFTGTTAVFAEDSVIQFISKSLSIVETFL
nr:uncharacterized protein LOC113801049 [Penaeus vannamei]